MLSAFIVNKHLKKLNILTANMEELIYQEVNSKSVKKNVLIKYLSNLIEYSSSASSPKKREVIIDLIDKINRLEPLVLKDFSNDKEIRNLYFDLIMCFERQENISELQTFIRSLMSLSSKKMNIDLVSGLILLHRHYEFSLRKDDIV